MKCQILFSGKNKKNIINLSSAENAQRVVKVNEEHKKKNIPNCRLRKFISSMLTLSFKQRKY